MKKIITMMLVMVTILSISAQAFAEEPSVGLIEELVEIGFKRSEDNSDQWILDDDLYEGGYKLYGIYDAYCNRGILYGYNDTEHTNIVIGFYWNMHLGTFSLDAKYEW
jgi:hypothetical protein